MPLFSFPTQVKLVIIKVANFGEVLCIQFSSKSGMSYIVESASLVAIQQ
jgi:hypothetical protein